MNILEKNIDDMIWSFSRINSFHTCKYMWYLTYIEKLKGLQNGHAEAGTLMHELMEDLSNNKLCLWDLVDEWKTRFNSNVKSKFMYNKYVDLKNKAFNNGVNFLETFEGFSDIGEVVSVEEKVETVLYDDITGKEYKFIGYIDLLLRDKDGRYIVLDHKSKSGFKKGKVKGVQVDEQHDYARQLYCYSKFVKEKYGEYPKELIFNMFNKKELIHIPFNMDDMNEAIKWCCEVIRNIYSELEFEPNVDYMFCHYLCGQRDKCNYKDAK